jgi:hypothetical protein
MGFAQPTLQDLGRRTDVFVILFCLFVRNKILQ